MRAALGVILTLMFAMPCSAAIDVVVPPAAVVPPPPDGPIEAVSFTRMAASLAEGQPFVDMRGTGCLMRGEPLTWSSRLNKFADPDFERIFRAEFARAGLKVSGDATNLFETDSKMADLQIGALITDIKARICAQPVMVNNSGAVAMTVEWQVYSASQGKVIARIVTHGGGRGSAYQSGDVLVKLVQTGFTENVRQLAATPAFRDIVLSHPRAAAAVVRPPPFRLALQAPSRPLALKEAAGGAVVVFAGSGSGSGVLVSTDGYILTNHHVAGETDRVRIRWSDGSETVGQVLRSDRRRDVALIKVAMSKGRALPVRRTKVELGETVYAIGTPLDAELQNTVTRGVVSALRIMEGQAFIQSDTPVTHGNSGGPLLDQDGSIVGLSDLGLDPSLGSSLNFFIPIADALKALGVEPVG